MGYEWLSDNQAFLLSCSYWMHFRCLVPASMTTSIFLFHQLSNCLIRLTSRLSSEGKHMNHVDFFIVFCSVRLSVWTTVSVFMSVHPSNLSFDTVSSMPGVFTVKGSSNSNDGNDNMYELFRWAVFSLQMCFRDFGPSQWVSGSHRLCVTNHSSNNEDIRLMPRPTPYSYGYFVFSGVPVRETIFYIHSHCS